MSALRTLVNGWCTSVMFQNEPIVCRLQCGVVVMADQVHYLVCCACAKATNVCLCVCVCALSQTAANLHVLFSGTAQLPGTITHCCFRNNLGLDPHLRMSRTPCIHHVDCTTTPCVPRVLPSIVSPSHEQAASFLCRCALRLRRIPPFTVARRSS